MILKTKLLIKKKNKGDIPDFNIVVANAEKINNGDFNIVVVDSDDNDENELLDEIYRLLE